MDLLSLENDTIAFAYFVIVSWETLIVNVAIIGGKPGQWDRKERALSVRVRGSRTSLLAMASPMYDIIALTRSWVK